MERFAVSDSIINYMYMDGILSLKRGVHLRGVWLYRMYSTCIYIIIQVHGYTFFHLITSCIDSPIYWSGQNIFTKLANELSVSFNYFLSQGTDFPNVITYCTLNLNKTVRIIYISPCTCILMQRFSYFQKRNVLKSIYSVECYCILSGVPINYSTCTCIYCMYSILSWLLKGQFPS